MAARWEYATISESTQRPPVSGRHYRVSFSHPGSAPAIPNLGRRQSLDDLLGYLGDAGFELVSVIPAPDEFGARPGMLFLKRLVATIGAEGVADTESRRG